MKNRLKKFFKEKKKILWTKIKNIKKDTSYFNFEMFSKPVKFPSSVI